MPQGCSGCPIQRVVTLPAEEVNNNDYNYNNQNNNTNDNDNDNDNSMTVASKSQTQTTPTEESAAHNVSATNNDGYATLVVVDRSFEEVSKIIIIVEFIRVKLMH